MKTTKQILQDVLELISEESKWTQNVLARDKSGADVSIKNVNAQCFCVMGAVDYCLYVIDAQNWETSWAKHGYPCIEAIYKMIPWEERQKNASASVSHFNDNRTHRDVIELLEKTIDSL